MKKFEGLIAAPFTPMDEQGEVLYGEIPAYCDFLVKNRVVGAFINGSTGEGVSLSCYKNNYCICFLKKVGTSISSSSCVMTLPFET